MRVLIIPHMQQLLVDLQINVIKYYELTINIVNELHSLVCLMNEKLTLGPIAYFWPSILSQTVGFIFDPWLCL